MTRTFAKSVASTGLVAGLLLSTAGVALPAGKPPISRDPNARFKPVEFINQTRIDAQGLTVKAALDRANRFEPYHVTTPHYIPRGFQLVIMRVFPYIPNQGPFSDTQTFYRMSAIKPVAPGAPLISPPDFEVDHQYRQPYTYPSTSQSTTAKAGTHTVTIAEQKGRNFKTHRLVDLLYVYWYDKKTRVATEVTADLQSSRLSRADLLKIAASIS